jgi:uncharacterized protein YggT (Ycf19 family)
MVAIWSKVSMLGYAYAWVFMVRFAMQWIDPQAKTPITKLLARLTDPVIEMLGPKVIVNGVNYGAVAAFFIINMVMGAFAMITIFFM